MKNPYSLAIITLFSIFTGLLHFMIGPDFHGPCKIFISGYLIDILLPANAYLWTQLVLRKSRSIRYSRIAGALITFLFGVSAEFLQFLGFDVLGTTWDPWDILMYGGGVCWGSFLTGF